MDEATIRRLAALILAPVFVVVSKKLGVDISESTINAVVGLSGLYIAVSNWKQTSLAKTAAKSSPAAPESTP